MRTLYYYGVASCFMLALFQLSFVPTIEAVELKDAVIALASGDARLVRYDAIPATVEKQQELCPTVMPQAAAVLKKSADLAALQTFILCITDNPANREAFGALALHGTIVKYLDTAIGKKDSNLIAAIGNLIWISVYGNAKNHLGFAPSVKSLAKVFDLKKEGELRPVAYMWSAAALQNLAASYCRLDNDPDDPGCYWEFLDPMDEHVSVNVAESGATFIDATSVRQAMLNAPGLVDNLVAWACKGPFHGPVTEDNPSAALNAVVSSAMLNATLPPHEDHANIVPWAAVGALKNLALLPAAKAALDPHEPCLCRLSQSYDWLEHTKASDLLGFLRPSFPCWFRWEPEDVEPRDVPLCVDHHFRDESGNTCYDYEYGTSEEDCEVTDAKNKVVTAKEACCGCNGGKNINMPPYVHGDQEGEEEADEL